MISAPQDCGCPIIPEGPSITTSPVCTGNFLFMVLVQQYLWGRCDISTPCDRVQSVEETKEDYDFIVVGGGAAGSIVAGRLNENGTFKVLLLEAGGPEPIGARVPSFYREFWGHDQVDWKYRTVLGDYCLDQGDKGCEWPRGKVLGGSSVLNGMMYHRGHRADFEDWVAAGATGWGWDDMLPYFDLTEGNKQIGTVVDGKYHSSSGPLPVQHFNYQGPQVQELLDAINETFPIITDINDPNTPEGFAVAQAFNYNGQRYTTARAYLEPQSKRSNLSVKLHTHVARVIFDGTRATGVEYIDEEGKTRTATATKEVILSAGALNSPHILLLSGVGPKATMESFKIPLIADLPVGQNLRNHVGVTLYFLLKKVNNTRELDWNVVTEYLLNRQGPMSATGITQLTGTLYSSYADKKRQQPDIQFFFNGFYAECSKTGVIGEKVDCDKSGYNVSANAAILLPKSVGYLTINSTDPLEQPLFYPNFFDHPDDIAIAKEGVKYLRQIFNSKLLQEKYEIVLDPQYTKKCDSAGLPWSDTWSECIIRVHTDPQNHQLGTTAIGAVVDIDLKVYNVTGLRVCDAGSMPTQPTGNPQGPIMAVAEKCAHLIRSSWTS